MLAKGAVWVSRDPRHAPVRRVKVTYIDGEYIELELINITPRKSFARSMTLTNILANYYYEDADGLLWKVIEP